MLTFATTHEERFPEHYIVRIHGYMDGAQIYARDAAFYVREGDGWCFGAIPETGRPQVSPVITTKPKARQLAERAAELLWLALLAQQRA